MSVMVFNDIVLNLFRNGIHIGKRFFLMIVKAVIVHTDQMVSFGKAVNDLMEVDLPCAGCARQQHQCLSFHISEFIEFHGLSPFLQ